jgi:hypothetical protein
MKSAIEVMLCVLASRTTRISNGVQRPTISTGPA